MISENTVLDLEGRCSIQLSYGRSQKDISGWPASAQARLQTICRGVGMMGMFINSLRTVIG
jgi:hypothetical protein